MATIKICDKCGAKATDVSIRGYRWMRLMDKCNYKHEMIIKTDLCGLCHSAIEQVLKDLLE